MSSIHWTFHTHQVSATRPQRHSIEQVEKGVEAHSSPLVGYLVGAELVMVSHNVLEPGARPAFNVAWTGLILW